MTNEENTPKDACVRLGFLTPARFDEIFRTENRISCT